jgi:glutamate racemase
MTSVQSPSACVGVFDSGVGGLSVLRALRERLPGVPLRYIADSAHAPYGERDAAHVIARSMALTRRLVDDGAQLVVVACNTATALAVQALRERWPELPVVGVEPGIKPAVARSRGGRIGVMATPATLGSARFLALLERHRGAAQWFLQPCPGLAAAIERGSLDDPSLMDLLQRFACPLREARVDTVVLGCTHYPFVAPALQRLLGEEVGLLDTAQAIAQRAAALCKLEPSDAATMSLQTTGSASVLSRLAQQWLTHEGLADHVMV